MRKHTALVAASLMSRTVTLNEWKATGKKLGKAKEAFDSSFAWRAGDWYNQTLSDVPYGYKAKTCAQLFGSRMTKQIQNFASVAKAWPPEQRIAGLPYSTHKEIAQLPHAQRLEVIPLLREGNLPRENLRDAMKLRRFHAVINGVKVSALDVRDFIAQAQQGHTPANVIDERDMVFELLGKLKQRLECMGDDERIEMLTAFHSMLDGAEGTE